LSSSEPAAGLARWRLDIAYDGSSFRGFAEQRDRDTVVGALRAELARTLRLASAPEVVGAGRTDAGVHALGQVVQCDLPDPLFGADADADADGDDAERLRRRLNGALRGRVVVLAASRAEAGFHARFSATSRSYRYLVVEGRDVPDFLSSIAWPVNGPLDVASMSTAAALVVGEHDFRAFCKRPDGLSADEPLLRVVHSAAWAERSDDLDLAPAGARLWRFDVTANAFCHQMVRSLVGAMVAVGRGALPLGEFADRLSDPRREGLPAPAPAAGLALVAVNYGRVARAPGESVS
jgi:tRNA pseudouridine38-40 synthase